jgi:hypothetical protein
VKNGKFYEGIGKMVRENFWFPPPPIHCQAMLLDCQAKLLDSILYLTDWLSIPSACQATLLDIRRVCPQTGQCYLLPIVLLRKSLSINGLPMTGQISTVVPFYCLYVVCVPPTNHHMLGCKLAWH